MLGAEFGEFVCQVVLKSLNLLSLRVDVIGSAEGDRTMSMSPANYFRLLTPCSSRTWKVNCLQQCFAIAHWHQPENVTSK
ncbi:hypothetical protein ACSQ6I_28195 [Anabaena sp. WFMT]|uniref:hypothetical protein n=1 Tax=Anabaena sp. WFMT TaxID=3449730 RepID=UPI003F271752